MGRKTYTATNMPFEERCEMAQQDLSLLQEAIQTIAGETLYYQEEFKEEEELLLQNLTESARTQVMETLPKLRAIFARRDENLMTTLWDMAVEYEQLTYGVKAVRIALKTLKAQMILN